jgi:enolase-phosphatase E1
VPASLAAWADQGLLLAVYSSGSVAAQRALFANAPGGDLNPLFSANFDLSTAGPKKEPDSYRRISSALGIPADRLLFLSDIQAEIDAARTAGWQAVGVLRAGEAQATVTGAPRLSRFDELAVVRAGRDDSRAGRT